MSIIEILKFLEENGVKSLERKSPTEWIVTETFGAETKYRVTNNSNDEVVAIGNVVNL